LQKNNFINNWKNYFLTGSNKTEFVVTVIVLVTAVTALSRFLLFNESRTGAVLNDPVLNSFNAVSLNFVVFFAIYSSLVIGLIAFSFHPEQLMTAFQTYTLLILLRMLAMYVIPLEPPANTIDLQDPVVFLIGTGQKITKDLFFSGHTSTAFLLFQVAKNKFLKSYFLLATVTVGVSVILQKAHYTIDVLAGIIFSYASYQLIKSFRKTFLNKSD